MPSPAMRQLLNRSPKKRYLLNDAFDYPLAAGALNGSFARPGPGIRTVVDSENKLSISGGKLVFAGGKASPEYGDPGAWYEARVRVAGRALLWEVTVSSGQIRIGWDSNQFGAGRLQLYVLPNTLYGGTTPVAIGTALSSVAYRMAISLRVAGEFYFIKGGIFTSWTLVWTEALNTTTPLFPAVPGYNAPANVSFITIPTRLWLPTPLAYDTFTRSDGALGSSEATGPDAQATPQLAWTGATWAISSGAAVNTSGAAFATQAHSTVNVIADITVTAYSAGYAGLVARADAAAENYVRVYQDAGNVKIDECVATSISNLGTYASAYAAGNTLRLSLDSTAWRLYKITAAGAATLLGSGTTNVVTGTLHGMFSTDAGNQLDNWICWARGNEGQYAVLDTL